ncbi:hypothetical protein BZJ19_03885 [Salinivibrio proteolyticus]|uniref:zinc uptake protein ZrgA n=1 Tax=Salinivibrio proteolyticus TaxID=334715 RepID=UPI0009894EE8|nr:DUF2796 domain-containing protein [Salinivibrio proteolyticus]OOF26861.1 hypothetical protein BZJ19_03885 [Salinivibrio proteolyticus]
MKTRFLPNVIAMAIATASTATLADEANYQSFDAHVHGEVTASLAQDGERVLIELTAPGHDVVGFEHHPKNAKDQQTLEDAYTLLRDGGKRFQLAEAANCQLVDVKVTSSFEDHDHDHKHEHEHEHEHEHNSIHGEDGEDGHAGRDGRDGRDGKDAHHEDHGDHHDHDKHEHNSIHGEDGEDGHAGRDGRDGRDGKDAHHDHSHHAHEGHHDHDKHGDHHDDHHGHDHGNHNTLSANYQFVCQNPQAFTELQTDWFSLFPNTETMKIQAFTDDKVWVETLNRAKSHIQW